MKQDRTSWSVKKGSELEKIEEPEQKEECFNALGWESPQSLYFLSSRG